MATEIQFVDDTGLEKQDLNGEETGIELSKN
ncbi:hypothetical protein [Gudongella sp.]